MKKDRYHYRPYGPMIIVRDTTTRTHVGQMTELRDGWIWNTPLNGHHQSEAASATAQDAAKAMLQAAGLPIENLPA